MYVHAQVNYQSSFEHIPVKTAIRLSDATILPILTYGSEVWALNSTLDYDKWDSCLPEKSHLDFIRHILFLFRTTQKFDDVNFLRKVTDLY